jgi:hypothetical protein
MALLEACVNIRGRAAPVAQLDRAPGYEPGGREFESLRAHHACMKLGACPGRGFLAPTALMSLALLLEMVAVSPLTTPFSTTARR